MNPVAPNFLLNATIDHLCRCAPFDRMERARNNLHRIPDKAFCQVHKLLSRPATDYRP